MKTTRREIIKAVGAATLVPTASQAMFANTQVQQSVDALVRQGAVILTKADSGGAKVIEVKLLGKQFDNGALEHLQSFPDLETLRCIDARVDDAFVKQLDKFPRLRVLGFFNAPVTDAGLSMLASSKVGGELRQLLLGRTKITDLGLKSIAKLPRLYLLELSGTKVTDTGINELAQLTPLKVLRFRGTAVSDKGIAQLGQLGKLMLLSVGGSRVTLSGIAELRKQIPGLVVTDEEITLSVEER
jgi:hypothetical protein